jgi:hypothetical protein
LLDLPKKTQVFSSAAWIKSSAQGPETFIYWSNQ